MPDIRYNAFLSENIHRPVLHEKRPGFSAQPCKWQKHQCMIQGKPSRRASTMSITSLLADWCVCSEWCFDNIRCASGQHIYHTTCKDTSIDIPKCFLGDTQELLEHVCMGLMLYLYVIGQHRWQTFLHRLDAGFLALSVVFHLSYSHNI